MNIRVDDLQKAILGVESDRQLSPEIVEGALKEALAKAYRKHENIPDGYVNVVIEDGNIHIYPQRVVVEEVEDDALELSVEDAHQIDPNAKIGDLVNEPEVDFKEFDRADVNLAKSVMKQKIREAEKQLIYEEYHDKEGDMILGTVETVEAKFVLVNIGKTVAMLRHVDQIPTEHYYEGQTLNVVIREVNKETKGAQVLVSRATDVFVRRLFEKEVPEIYQGIVEIKAIAREPGERCKIAVYSHNENIDPIGACIGPRGQRVQAIINELNGEKIDIFEWSDNISVLIQNALSPSESLAVFPNPNVKDGLIVVVPDNQLSLAIGKRGKNARLAVRLTNHKIDIKSVSEMEEAGIDYMALAQEMNEQYEEKKAAERAYKQQQRIEQLKNEDENIETVDIADFDYDDEEEVEFVPEQEDIEQEEVIEEPQSVSEPEPEVEKEEDEIEKAARIAKEQRGKERAVEVNAFHSKFENFADASHKEENEPKKWKKKPEDVKKQDDEEQKTTVKQQFEQMKPIYSEEELAEIEEEEEYEDESRWDDDVDYEDFDKYYD
ncbi:transcription termination factor NusA [Absicoccus intestinalis]|uniref:Transcription termination/antitermination protein NusA n=1 Tax=Absicoccus intestinalis TaxID=2926319 RepID=A0ABU4WJF2_9FIRM|nr:transcription termination factor NusA [Absicoccus sp. CLA-KB-P134]MDX8416675.1 transcription termination factor NusA [Absicoccus sp. CLA-KB-P134]